MKPITHKSKSMLRMMSMEELVTYAAKLQKKYDAAFTYAVDTAPLRPMSSAWRPGWDGCAGCGVGGGDPHLLSFPTHAARWEENSCPLCGATEATEHAQDCELRTSDSAGEYILDLKSEIGALRSQLETLRGHHNLQRERLQMLEVENQRLSSSPEIKADTEGAFARGVEHAQKNLKVDRYALNREGIIKIGKAADALMLVRGAVDNAERDLVKAVHLLSSEPPVVEDADET